MRKLISPTLCDYGNDIIGFWCPGCNEVHTINVGPKGWGYNGDAGAPTFTPSVLVRGGHYAPGRQGPNCYCKPHPNGEEWGFKCKQCHSFVTDGKIRFLGDCSHELVNQTVPLPPFPAERC